VICKTVKLGSVCYVRRGTTITKKQAVDGEVPVIGGGKKPTYYHNKANRKVNCITVSGSGASAGYVNMWDIPIFASDCSTVEPKDETQIAKFIYFYLYSKQSFIYENFRSGAAQPHVYAKDIASLSYPVLTLAEQKRIVAKLDKEFAEIDKAIAATQKKHVEILLVFQNFLLERFNSLAAETPQYTLREIAADFGRGKSKHRPRNDEKLYGNKMPFIQTGDVSKADVYIKSYSKKYSEFGLKQSKVWEAGTVCITIAANIAELGILDIQACFPDSVIGVFPNHSKTNSKYVYYLLSYFQSYIKSKSKGSAQQNINLGTFENEKFPFPSSIEEQVSIVNELDFMYEQCKHYSLMQQSKTKHLYSLKASLLQNIKTSEVI
jgi:type I restriction enzyme S subunit